MRWKRSLLTKPKSFVCDNFMSNPGNMQFFSFTWIITPICILGVLHVDKDHKKKTYLLALKKQKQTKVWNNLCSWAFHQVLLFWKYLTKLYSFFENCNIYFKNLVSNHICSALTVKLGLFKCQMMWWYCI